MSTDEAVSDPRIEPPQEGDERATLLGFLTYHRDTLAMKCDGLDAAQLADRAVEPSDLSLLGLLRHMAEVERNWFRRVLAGEDAPPYYYSEVDRDGDFDNVAPDPTQVQHAYDAWRAEIAFADELVTAAADLDVTGKTPGRGPVSLRWVLVHMVEEYARHNGHADLLRQRIDGSVGE